MKAIIETGKTYKVTGEKGDFTICEDNKGKRKMFQTSKVNIIEIEVMPKAKKYKNSTRQLTASESRAFRAEMAYARYLEHV